MKTSEWISVDDKLPDIGERVLVYIPRPDNHYNIEIAYISEGKDDYPYWVLREKSQFYSTRFHYISHWASFPESPKNDDTKDACTRHLCGLCDKFSIIRADREQYQYRCTLYNKTIPAIGAVGDIRPKDFRD